MRASSVAWQVDPESFDPVTIFFSEIVGFNEIVAVSPPEKVVLLLSSLYSMFDQLVTKHGIFKVETIGDTLCVPRHHPSPPRALSIPKRVSLRPLRTPCLRHCGRG